jgi:hypothetical protein
LQAKRETKKDAMKQEKGVNEKAISVEDQFEKFYHW